MPIPHVDPRKFQLESTRMDSSWNFAGSTRGFGMDLEVAMERVDSSWNIAGSTRGFGSGNGFFGESSIQHRPVCAGIGAKYVSTYS